MDYKYVMKGFGRTKKMVNEERVQFIQQLLITHEQGVSLNILANKYGISRRTVQRMIQKAKQYRKDLTSIPITKQELAKIVHRHRSTLWRWGKNKTILP